MKNAPRAALAFVLGLAFLVPAEVRAQDPAAAMRRVPLDVETVRRRNAEALRRLGATGHGYSITLGAVEATRPERVTLPPVGDPTSAQLLDRARSLLASPEARLRNLVVEIRKEFFRGAEESSERHRLWAELLLEQPSGRRIGINELAEAIVHDSRNAAAWAALERELPQEGKKLVSPGVVAVRAGLASANGRVSIVLDPRASSRAATAAWLAYARTRALWSGGGRFAERFGATEPYRETGAEIIDAAESLAETYEIERASDTGPADPELEWLQSLRREGLLRAFVHVDWAPGPLAEARRGGVAPEPESIREYLGRHRVDPPSRTR